jgi:hypothetical protein
MRASLYRKQLAVRFITRRDFTDGTQESSYAF